MKKTLTVLLFVFLLCSLIIPLNAQRSKRTLSDAERFNAGLVIGLNITQLDGDYFVGYDKSGLTGGVKGIVRLTPRLDFNMELLYSVKGSKIFSGNRLGTSPIKDRIVDLNYVDVPFLFKWLLKNTESSFHVEGGLVYSRLINSKITEKLRNPATEFSYQAIINDFDSDDISWVGGLGYTWKGGLSIHSRFVFGLTQFYQNENFIPPSGTQTTLPAVEFLRNYFVSFQVAYTLF